jgi:MarR family 2-MHQ and catechol resistance regulon transcriptional repressor
MSVKNSNSNEQALNTYVKLMRAADTVTSMAHRHLKDDKLSISQFAALELLYHTGPQHQSDIARKILKSCGNITTVIDNLEKRGLVTRQRRTCDRRYITVSLTEGGHSLITRVFPRHAEEVGKAMSCLGKTELEALGNLCRCLGKSASRSTTGKDDPS